MGMNGKMRKRDRQGGGGRAQNLNCWKVPVIQGKRGEVDTTLTSKGGFGNDRSGSEHPPMVLGKVEKKKVGID